MTVDMATLGALWSAGPMARAALVALATLLVAAVVSVGFRRVVMVVARRTETELDDLVAQQLRVPVTISVLMVGLWYAISFFGLPAVVDHAISGVLMTALVLLWGVQAAFLVGLGLEWLVRNKDRYPSVVSERTEPLFGIIGKTVIFASSVYFVFLAWNVDLTAWLASAGLIGIAVGFAAQDTLSNLVAGVAILTDSPYKIGDYLILENGLHGRVTEIGIRTTRILTNDDVEVVVPNQRMANSQIVNHTGGPYPMTRIRVPVGIAYGTDIDLVRRCLIDEARKTSHVTQRPFPLVRFRSFGSSYLDFEVQTWIDEPYLAERVIDELNTRIYKRFAAEGIEIPFPKQEVYLHPAPAAPDAPTEPTR